MGEKEPLDVFEISHGVCIKCQKTVLKNQHHAKIKEENFLKTKDFFQEILSMSHLKVHDDKDELIKKGLDLGIDPISLIYGILQPLMYRMGNLVKNNQVSLMEEYLYTSTIQKMINRIEFDYDIEENGKEILLTNVEGNVHLIACRILRIALAQRGYSSKLIFPALSSDKLVHYLKEHPAKVLCISIATEDQQPALLESLQRIKELDEEIRPLVAIGGRGLRYSRAKFLRLADFIQDREETGAFFDFIDEFFNVKAA